MAPERDLGRMLAALDVRVRDGRYAVVSRASDDPVLAENAQAMVREAEGITYVVPVAGAAVGTTVEASGIATDEVAFEAAWLTLGVSSALDAIGLTAAVSAALAERGIACNVLAGAHHDHLLVPFDRRDEAVAALSALAHRAVRTAGSAMR